MSWCGYREVNGDEKEEQIKALVAMMSLEEKVAQMAQLNRSAASPFYLKTLGVGSLVSTGPIPPINRAVSSEWADMVDEYQKLALQSRHGIPILYAIDAVHGNNAVHDATIFPHNIGLGATRDADLVRRIGAATALEVRASGIHFALAPCVAVSKDPRWGRYYESYGEDTNLVRELTTLVTGLQGQPPKGHPPGYPFVAGRKNVVACAKHFVGDGGTESGKNAGNTLLSYEDLESIHIAPYVDCINQGIATIMVSYSSWNGHKLHSHHFLLTEVLKNKLNFKGMVISDWEGISKLSEPRGSNYRQCLCAAINAGIDMVMVGRQHEEFFKDMVFLVESGLIPMPRIDDAVERILRVKFVAGLFEHPFADRSLLDIVGCKLHRDLAREAVRKSLVLLKNGKDPMKPFLPLPKNASKILLAGTHADDLGYQCGGWTIAWQGLPGKITSGTTIFEAIKKVVGKDTVVVHEKYPSADCLSGQDFSYAIVVVGEGPYAETMGDNSDLVIPFNGTGIISCVADALPTLVILISGRPLVVEEWVLEKIDALVAAWLPGSEGDGITDVIFGDYDFQGRLPVTWFRSIERHELNNKDKENHPFFSIRRFRRNHPVAPTHCPRLIRARSGRHGNREVRLNPKGAGPGRFCAQADSNPCGNEPPEVPAPLGYPSWVKENNPLFPRGFGMTYNCK